MEKDKKKTKFIHQPEYPGGPRALTKFVYEQLRYPGEALEAGIEGVVYLEYDVNYEGLVVGTRVLKGLGYGCDEEAARIARLLKFHVGRNRGMHVLFHQKLKIQFKKPKQKPAPAPTEMQLSYTVTPESKPSQPAATPAQKETSTYHYTITFNQ